MSLWWYTTIQYILKTYLNIAWDKWTVFWKTLSNFCQTFLTQFCGIVSQRTLKKWKFYAIIVYYLYTQCEIEKWSQNSSANYDLSFWPWEVWYCKLILFKFSVFLSLTSCKKHNNLMT